MQNDKLKNYLHLHVLVFIAGFTAIIGKLITINAVSLVWYRMLMATVLMFIYIKVAKVDISITKKAFVKLAIAGIIIALHWITFFGAIQVANASIALAMFSTGAFFASFIEPIIYKRKIIAYEIVFGLIVILGVYLIVRSEFKYIDGMILGIISAFLSSLFAVLNGKFLEEHSATKISFYEFLSGVFFISLYILCFGEGFNVNHFNISLSDGLWLFVLASVCTAYAFIASVYVMRYISPYTVVLTYNLEPIYGIILALLLFPESETMSSSFYIGAFIILGVVLLNGVLKNLKKFKKNKIQQTN
ncbi:DMT family transporter [Olleya marilimosa]|jgi:drug/metabolite transporter (DMT)-like permease|uniref:DMT family transporter n=1 Tax=Olleya marilimosa TaxID=272164 RepID=A0ABR8LYU7_9FLAO|nr:DMT family transporter [Olleya marilimosa]MBD3863670.1 DMT family transporter [Olleya marilimosa]MBD3891427.1 DMT family transporter [Olleya marilimosa]